MRQIPLMWLILLAAFARLISAAQAAEVHVPPLGFHTIDMTPQTWSQLKPDYRFKGKVSDTLKFSDIEDIWVLRCLMHVRDSGHIANTVEIAIPAQAAFLGDDVPDSVLRIKDKALLTIMFKTRKGAFGLMHIYAGLTILELDQKYGAVLNKQR